MNWKVISTYLPEITVSFDKRMWSTPIILKTSRDVYNVFMSIWNKSTIELYEEMKVLFLDRKLALIGYRNLWIWNSTWTVVNTKLLLSIALSCNAEGFILWHNHPSWTSKPSESDISITKRIKEWAKLIDLNLIDHLIVTKDKYYSFADEGY